MLPEKIRTSLEKNDLSSLIEIVMDYGRLPEARFFDGKRIDLEHEPITLGDINYAVNRVGDFTSDNRAGIERTLHRISCVRNRRGEIVGLTCRVGRTVTGTIDLIRDLIESKKSILLLGPPGVGKTTKLREMARVLADDLNKRVIVIDTSNEIAGDGDIPHAGIGRSRRMQVAKPEFQHAVMIEAVENHTPEVIIIDEIGTELEAAAARTIAERGVQLIGTAHGNALENLLKNPTLSDLVGGIQTVTLGDEEAKRRGTQKTILERAAKPTFDIAVEIVDHQRLAIHKDVAMAVDTLLRGRALYPEVRKLDRATGKIEIVSGKETTSSHGISFSTSTSDIPEADIDVVSIYPYAVSRGQLERVIRTLELPAKVSRTIDEAGVIFALKNYAKQGAKIIELSKKHKKPLYVVKNNTIEGIQKALKDLFPELVSDFIIEEIERKNGDDKGTALEEAKAAINVVMDTDKAVDLSPQNPQIRKLQHELIEEYKLDSLSIGQEPTRRVRIFPPPKPGDQ
ncbi:MAG: single-stranded DNA-binding protein [Candidatus Melainabacteria bacterium RIFCSPHIGHO2_02_FULL_34_12]|nr:MAG: single-stranded DNA-binding protein [Candidatus Melainabacteria bacterium RIFCSPHIGHO2_02_FULL_34_12]